MSYELTFSDQSLDALRINNSIANTTSAMASQPYLDICYPCLKEEHERRHRAAVLAVLGNADVRQRAFELAAQLAAVAATPIAGDIPSKIVSMIEHINNAQALYQAAKTYSSGDKLLGAAQTMDVAISLAFDIVTETAPPQIQLLANTLDFSRTIIGTYIAEYWAA